MFVTTIFEGLRGTGKTYNAVRAVNTFAQEQPGRRLVFAARDKMSVQGVMAKALRDANPMVKHDASRGRLIWPNGSEAHCFMFPQWENLEAWRFDGAYCETTPLDGPDAGLFFDELRTTARLASQPPLFHLFLVKNTD